MITKYRHEYKYVIDKAQMSLLENRINKIMKLDPNAINGIYNIRSLYFDDYYHNCFYDNQNGNDPREKFRIRIYNHSDERISLECKRKENSKTLKTSCLINKQQCLSLMENHIIDEYYKQDTLLKKLTCKMLNDGLRASTIIEYNRKPYIYNDGNVRITFDTDISSSTYVNSFFENDLLKRQIMPKGEFLLEVKYDDFLPDVIYNALQLNFLDQSAFSKFYLGEYYALGRNIIK